MKIENFDEKYEKLSDLEKIRVQNSLIQTKISGLLFFIGIIFFISFGFVLSYIPYLYFAYLLFGIDDLLNLMFIIGLMFFAGVGILIIMYRKRFKEQLKKNRGTTKQMKTKEFVHNDFEECKLTKKKIDVSKDKYAIILDCDSDKITSIGFYKIEELKEFMKGNVEKVVKQTMERTQGLAGNMIGGVLSKFGLTKEMVEIK